ncbi:unnamed protein product [Prunus brigantina]
MIGRADIEGSKSNVAMNAWLPQADYPLIDRPRFHVPEGTLPVRPPAGTRRPALAAGAARAVHRRPTGYGARDPRARPSSQSFSRGYGSILPTSLAYIVPSTGGCSPWRHDAVMSTAGREWHSVLRIFKGRRGRTGHHATCGALPARLGPYLRAEPFPGID